MDSCGIDEGRKHRFHEAMLDLYEAAVRACRIFDARFKQMVANHGGVETAKLLLQRSDAPPVAPQLWQCGRLDLTVEALVLQPEWLDLFTAEERSVARERLRELRYPPVLQGQL